MTGEPHEKVGTPEDFARLFGAAQAEQRPAPEPEAEPTPEPELPTGEFASAEPELPMSAHADSEPPPTETAATPVSLEDLRREAGIRAGLPEQLADSVQGDDWAAIQAHAAKLGEIWRKHVEQSSRATLPDFDGGPRAPAPAVTNGYAAHNNLIVDLIRRTDSW